MAHIHYKFASKRSSDTVVFDGPHMTLKELKRLIMEKEKLRSGDCDLRITNAQTNEEFTDDEGLIARGSSVVVRRIPVVGARSSSNAKLRNIDRSDGRLHQPFGAVRAMGAQSSSSTLPLFSKMTNLAFVDASEEDKLKVLVNQSLYDSTSYNMKAGPGLPANYSCFRCGGTGHHIRNCPSSGQDKTTEAPLRIKKSTGIPRSFMVEVDDPSIKGAMLTNCGHYAIPALHAKAYAVGKKEKPPFGPQEPPKPKAEDPVPKELLCLICKEMLSDAVVIPCCANSFCDDCIRTALLDSDQHTCPTCKQSDVSPDTLIANKFLRQAVNTFQKDQGQSKSSTGNDGASQPVNPAWAPDPVLKKKPHQSAPKPQPPEPTAQRRLAPLLTTGPAPPPAGTSSSLQPLQTQTKTFKSDREEQTCDQAAAAEPSERGSGTDAAAAVVSDSACEETHQPASVTPQQSDPVAGPVWPPAFWESTSSSSSSSCPPSSSSSSLTYPSVPPPLFPPPHFPSFLTAQHHLTSYLPGYPGATPVWSVQPPQGPPIAPNPPLCSSTRDWYKHQRDKNETRSPHRGSSHRRSSSRSKSSKSSRSYSRSSSRSRSRSRSVSRSRHQSPYSRSRHLHTRSHSSSYGHKRSSTPSSSSSPRLSHHSRSKSPSDHRKKSHPARHHSRKSSSVRSSSGRRGEHGQEGRGSEESRASDPRSGAELDRQRYLQWEKDYKEWCDKYLSSYVSHFHQLPPLLNLPPSPRRLLEDAEENGRGSRGNVESRSRRHGSRSTAHTKDGSTPSRSSSDGCSTASQSSVDSRSSPSRSSNPSRSPASRLSSDGYLTPSKPRAADRTEDGRKEARRPPRSRRDETSGPEKSDPRQPSESVQPWLKDGKQTTVKRERRARHNSEEEKHQANKEAGRIHSGNSKTESRSEKPGKRRGDDAESRSSKCLKTSPTEVCKSRSQHPPEEEKKAQPASERDIWEGGMKVKPQKRISINISLDGRKKEEKNGQSSTGKPGEDVHKSDDGGEEKQGGDAKADVNPEEEEEEEGKGLLEDHDEMKASTNKEVTTGEGRSAGQERREFLTGENMSTETESRVEVKLKTETKEDRTRSLSEQEKAEREGRHGRHGNGLEQMVVVVAPEEFTNDGASDGDGRITQVAGSKRETEASVKKEQDEEFKAEPSLGSRSEREKPTVSGPHCGTAPPSGRGRFHSAPSSRDRKRETEMENDRARPKEKEGKRSEERRKKEENHRDREEEQSRRKSKGDQGKTQESRPHRCSERLPASSHKGKDDAAGSHASPPPLHPRGWGDEKGLLPSEDVEKSPTDVMGEEKAREERSADGVINVCRLQGGAERRHPEEEEEEKKGLAGATRPEQEGRERPSSSSASRERSGEPGRSEWMKPTKHKKEKRESAHELLEEREKDRKSKKSSDGKED